MTPHKFNQKVGAKKIENLFWNDSSLFFVAVGADLGDGEVAVISSPSRYPIMIHSTSSSFIVDKVSPLYSSSL